MTTLSESHLAVLEAIDRDEPTPLLRGIEAEETVDNLLDKVLPDELIHDEPRFLTLKNGLRFQLFTLAYDLEHLERPDPIKDYIAARLEIVASSHRDNPTAGLLREFEHLQELAKEAGL